MCVRQGHTNAKYYDDDDDKDDNDENQILVLVQIETGHIQINSSAGRKRLDCRNIKNTRMRPGNKMATRGKAVHKAC